MILQSLLSKRLGFYGMMHSPVTSMRYMEIRKLLAQRKYKVQSQTLKSRERFLLDGTEFKSGRSAARPYNTPLPLASET